MADKTLPPLKSGAQYKLSVLSKACLHLEIQKEGVHNSLEDAQATMDLFQHGHSWILPNIVSFFYLFFFFLNPIIQLFFCTAQVPYRL